MITAQEAHDYCLAAATVIPILMLTQFVLERNPIEANALKYQRDIDYLESAIFGSIADHDYQRPIAHWSQRMLRSIMTRVGKDDQRSRQSERAFLLAERAIIKEEIAARERYVKSVSRAATIATVLLLFGGFIGEFFALFGLLGAVDQYYAITVSFASIGFILVVIAQMILYRLFRSLAESNDDRITSRIIIATSYFVLTLTPIVFVVIAIIRIHSMP